MSAYLSFDGRIEPMEWGKNTYTVLRLPPKVSDALQSDGARRVEGEINDHPVNLALTKAPVIDGLFLYAGKTLLDEIGIAPGDPVEVRLRKADPTSVDVPRDVVLALRSAGMSDAWEAQTPGKQRGLLQPVRAAKRAETRAKRIEKLIDALNGAA